MSYELWLQAGKPDDEPDVVSMWPPTYLTFFDRWPQAFEYYRHAVFDHLTWALQLSPWASTLNSLLRRARHRDVSGYEHFIEVLRTADEKFQRQRQADHHMIAAVGDARDSAARLTSALSAYSSMYETDLPIWLVGVVARAQKSGVLDPSYLGGPDTSTAQGALVREVTSDVVGTPLEAPFNLAYDRDLRNAAAHYDWEFVDSQDRRLMIKDHRSGRQWTEEECWDRIEASQHMQHAVVLTAQLAVARALEPLDSLVDVGILSFSSLHPDDGGMPTYVVPQVWCFRDLDPSGQWIDQQTLTIHARSDGTGMSQLTENARADGPALPVHLVRRMSDDGWVRVVRVPVAPPAGLGLPTLKTAEGETFEVVGTPDEHVVPAVVVID